MKKGFDSRGISLETGKKHDKEGYDEYGYDIHNRNKEGRNLAGYDRDGYDKEGNDVNGFNKEGIHKITKTKYDERGYDKDRFDAEGYNIHKFDRNGIHKYTKTKYNEKGVDCEGYDERGFKVRGKRIHKETGTLFNPEGYDAEGYNEKGFNSDGINRRNFNREGINLTTKTRFDTDGYDIDFYDEDGYHKDTNFSREGIHRETKTFYDPNGLDVDGYNNQGEDKKGNIREIDNKTLYPYAIQLVNYYLDSSYLSYKEMYKKEESITEDRFKFLLDIIKEENPEKYEEIKEGLDKKQSARFAKLINGVKKTINHIENGIETPNGDIRKYEYFDLLLETKSDISSFEEAIKTVKNYGIAVPVDVYIFIEKTRNRNKILIRDDEQVLNNKLIYNINGKEVTVSKQQKLDTLNYMEEHSLPKESGIYSSLLRNYVRGNIHYNTELNDMFKENSKDSVQPKKK